MRTDYLLCTGADDKMIAALRDLELRFEEKAIDLKASVEKAELELVRAHENKDVQEKDLYAAIDKVYKAKADLMKLHVTAMVEAREVMGQDLFTKILETHGAMD